MDSILLSIKTMLNDSEENTCFDSEIMMHINSALMVLSQLGVGLSKSFFIEGRTETWADLLIDRTDLEGIKTYIFLKVKLVFDPPASSFVMESMKDQIKELEVRILYQVG